MIYSEKVLTAYQYVSIYTPMSINSMYMYMYMYSTLYDNWYITNIWNKN